MICSKRFTCAIQWLSFNDAFPKLELQFFIPQIGGSVHIKVKFRGSIVQSGLVVRDANSKSRFRLNIFKISESVHKCRSADQDFGDQV